MSNTGIACAQRGFSRFVRVGAGTGAGDDTGVDAAADGAGSVLGMSSAGS